MVRNNIRGLLLSLLVGAVMVAGVLIAGKANADTADDYQYYSYLESEGLVITDRALAKATAFAICQELALANDWQTIMATLMAGGDWDVDTAATVFAGAVTIYCPELKPDFNQSSPGRVA